MRTYDERLARWVVNGTASGEPMAAETAVEVLNELFEMDPEAADRLFNARVPCNETLADHPTVVCRPTTTGHEVGLLGVINGILAREDPCGSGVAALVDPETKRLMGFAPIECLSDLQGPV